MKAFLKRLFIREPETELVRYYDVTTKTVVRIPKAELRPGVVLVRVEGDSEPMYADSAALGRGPIHHSALSEEVHTAIGTLATDLADVYPQSVSQWEEGFLRDRDPEREVAGWMHLTAILKVMTDRFAYGPAERKECFRILVACFTGTRDTVTERSDPAILPRSQVDQTIKYFFEGGYS